MAGTVLVVEQTPHTMGQQKSNTNVLSYVEV